MTLLDILREKMEIQAFNEVLESIWSVIRAANAYVDRQAPWKLKKDDPARMATVLYVLADIIRQLAILTQSFMPDSSCNLLEQLGVDETRRDFQAFSEPLVPGAALPNPRGVFPRFQELG